MSIVNVLACIIAVEDMYCTYFVLPLILVVVAFDVIQHGRFDVLLRSHAGRATSSLQPVQFVRK